MTSPAETVIPMKLFTLFTNDARALEEIRSGWTRVEAVIRKLSKHDEWSIRLVFDDARAPIEDATLGSSSGRGYLMAKRQHLKATTAHTAAMRKVAAAVLKALTPLARDARQRPVATPPESKSRLLLDAAFLVPRAKAARFRASAERQAKTFSSSGYALQVTGPWPPYSFVDNS
jgi:hypothetical protein